MVAPTYTAIPTNPSWLTYEENAADFSDNGGHTLPRIRRPTASSATGGRRRCTVGGQETLTATGTQIAGDNFTPPTVPIADPVSHVWSSSDPKVASVDARTGAVTAHRPGTATITVTAGGITGKVMLTIK